MAARSTAYFMTEIIDQFSPYCSQRRQIINVWSETATSPNLYDATFDREFIKFVTLREESKNSTFTFHAFKLSDK